MRAIGCRRSQRRRMAPRRCANRFTGFISEPSGRFVSQRIRVRTRHTAIQKSRENDASARPRGTRGPVRRRVRTAWRSRAR
ncbi:hypothetical protein A8F72_30930 [Burkholderia cenocepacia]|nr:hypothetical protein A8F32_07265 [Burkholderia cenocepacia]ARF87329.1 uncharacterized protein BCN122_II0586 [Burkholderia cenocepacia]ONI95979.1 hypothetical protein A8F33_27205 [Burkholderia cenocepacia]ONJ00496.1 hypothetical protein A8F53_10405 [Burkholderia cenocepacia]OOA05078.1 hypothetical protein A8F55_32690 [Burkholderia cenocepacia]